MKSGKRIREIFFYVVAALFLGAVIGGIDALFGRVLLAITDFRGRYINILIWFLPIAGLSITWMYHHFNETSLKGMTLVLEAAQGKREDIPLALVPLVMLGTWITHLFGGSAGREGVAVQIGATLSNWFARRFKFDNDNAKILLIAGMAAGFGGLFQTPFAAVFFAMEVVITGKMLYQAFLPSLIAAVTASKVSHALCLEKFEVPFKQTVDMSEPKILFYLVVLGVLFGLAGRLFSVLLKKAKVFMGEKFKNPYKRIGLVSIPLAIILFVLWNGRYCGLGTNLISQTFAGQDIYIFDWLIKLLLTVLTLSIGFQGGEVTPLFSIGATLGYCLGNLFGISPVLCGALGYAAVFGSATNTVIAPFLIGVEVFGTGNCLAFVLVCSIAYIVNGNRCIYGAQGISYQ
ncbi:chloride channel protein [Eubacterium sp. MSJ-13]|uniref:chloride channel protein n=1 Tax=Eubacterium sp. MSJ-13 TaxID=2841513 RepID=UPI001C0F8DA5|nr:chloride channel protein [Eubacterium sp. MSJ-13]MBU5479583.1 chloride channel protein [Eubacterium sp. MSJ-13]